MSETITGVCTNCEAKGLLYYVDNDLVCYLCRYRLTNKDEEL